MPAAPDAQPRPSFLDALAVYFKPRVLIVMFLGFSSGLPLALSGATLLVWMRESGVDLGTIGLFARVGAPGLVARGALLVAAASATQDIVVDAFRVESLPENEQAAGMASYVAAYRIGMLISPPGGLFLAGRPEGWGPAQQAAWHWG